jgi:hypothetical protein
MLQESNAVQLGTCHDVPPIPWLVLRPKNYVGVFAKKCPGLDLNQQEIALTTTSTLRVCQFRHLGMRCFKNFESKNDTSRRSPVLASTKYAIDSIFVLVLSRRRYSYSQ